MNAFFRFVFVSCVLFAANGECIDEESSSVAVLKGEDLELMCTSLIPGSDWYGYDAEDIQCKEGSYIKKCTVEGIGTQFTIESFEMELVLANGTCVKKCTFQINIVPEYVTTSLADNTISASTTTTTSINIVLSSMPFSTAISSSLPGPSLMSTSNITTQSLSILPVTIAVVITVIIIITIVLLMGSILLFIKLRVTKVYTQNPPQQLDNNDNGFYIGSPTTDFHKEQDTIVSFSDIVVEELVNKGLFVLTHQAVINNHGEVTVKRLKANVSQDGYNELKHEIAELKKIKQLDNSSNSTIPLLIGVTQEPLCLIIERLPSNNLKLFLHSLYKGPTPEWYIKRIRTKNVLTEQQISHDLMSILIQVAEGQKYLCDNGIIHCCLSSRNVLIGNNLVVKLSEFLPPASGEHYIGTGRGEYLESMAPESMKDGIHTRETVIWSFGIMMFRVATLETIYPFNKTTPDKLYMQIQNGMRPISYPTHSKEYYRQLQECLKFEPNDRPNFDQVIHTLLILHENSSQHLTLNMSSKKKGYTDGTGNIFLFPIKQTTRFTFGALHNSQTFSITDDDFSTTESGIELPQRNYKLTKKLSSLIKHTKPSSDDSALSEFEHMHLIQHDTIERHNPLANN